MSSFKRQKLAADESPRRNRADDDPRKKNHRSSSSGSRRDSPNGKFESCSRQSSDFEYIMLKPSKKKVLFCDGGAKRKVDDPFAYEESPEARSRMKAALEKFHTILPKFVDETNGSSWKASCAAAKRLLEQQRWLCVPKKLGHIAGVEIGDKFQSRAELKVAGLHHHSFQGIDCTVKDGEILAASIVASGRYENDIKGPDKLVFVGQGGNPTIGCKQLVDQKIERGNRALINSMRKAAPIRVVYGVNLPKVSEHIGVSGKKLINKMYVYDGLYTVDSYCQDRGQFGKLVFKFSLTRVAGQPRLVHGRTTERESSGVARAVVCVSDISRGKEKVPVRFKKAPHEENLPDFDYITKVIYPKSHVARTPLGCSCDCAANNGGSMSYDTKGRIITSKPIIYECGPGCKCPSSSCTNRVSQNGISFQLEVFRSKLNRWGVRSRGYIPNGSFVCEYVGEVLNDAEVEERIASSYRNLLSQGCTTHVLSCSPGLTIDATLRGNVGRFVNHSDSPNLRAQCVLYDHNDVEMPHVMLFATKDIPPRHELTIDCSQTMAKFGMRCQ